jgi:hypothetical protein
MKVRTTIARNMLGTRLTAVGCGISAILTCVVLSACSGSSSTTTPAIFTPSVTGSASPTAVPGSRPASVPATTTASPSAGSTASATATATTSAKASATATGRTSPTAAASPTPRRSASTFPSTAPSTGGGGTAGVQDVLLFGLGGGAILAGAGSIAYRRKLTRDR